MAIIFGGCGYLCISKNQAQKDRANFDAEDEAEMEREKKMKESQGGDVDAEFPLTPRQKLQKQSSVKSPSKVQAASAKERTAVLNLIRRQSTIRMNQSSDLMSLSHRSSIREPLLDNTPSSNL